MPHAAEAPRRPLAAPVPGPVPLPPGPLWSARGVRRGCLAALPMAASVVPWGLAFGLVARQLPLSFPAAVTFSGWTYSGTAQLIVSELWGPPFPLVTILLAVLAVNGRYLVQGATLAPYLAPLDAGRRLVTLGTISDGSWALAMGRFQAGSRDVGFLFGANTAMYATWVGSTALGWAFPVDADLARTWGLDFAASAALIALLGSMARGRSSVRPWLVAAVAGLLARELLGGHAYLFIGGLSGAVAGALQEDGRGR